MLQKLSQNFKISFNRTLLKKFNQNLEKWNLLQKCVEGEIYNGSLSTPSEDGPCLKILLPNKLDFLSLATTDQILSATTCICHLNLSSLNLSAFLQNKQIKNYRFCYFFVLLN